jgi:tetratricopeptide (TPR) repeat protein
MPLGIELAAAWVKMLSCREIAHEIERSLGFLATSMRDMPQRHRSLRAVFDHSWQLLSEAERSVFRRLSVFRGGFQREAAAQVAGADLPLLSALVDKSLLRQHHSGRYEMHELLRQYAAETLDEVPQEKQGARDMHCGYCMAFLQHREGDLKGARQKQAVEEVSAEIGNVRAAWRWATQQGKVREIGQGAESLYRFYQIRSLPNEGEEAFAQAVAALEAQADPAAERGVQLDLVLGMALAFQGFFACEFYLTDKGQALFRRSLALLRPLGPRKDLALAIDLSVYKQLTLAATFGAHEDAVQDITQAEQLLQQSLTIQQEAGERWGMAFSLHLLGLRASLRGDYATAQRLLRESLAIRSEIGDRWGMARSLSSLGRIAWRHLGAREEAKRLFQESQVIYRELGDRWAEQLSLDCTGYVARELGEYEQARQLHQDSLAVAKECGDLLGIAGSLENLGLVARDLGAYEEAEAYLQEGLAIRVEVGHQFSIAVSLENMGDLALALGDYQAARRHYNSSLEVYETHGYFGCVTPHRGLAGVCTALGDTEQAGKHFHAALKAAADAAHVSLVLDVLACMAQLAAKMAQNERAAELLALVVQHPASSLQTRNKAERLLSELGSQVPPEALATARERSKGVKLEEIVGGVLQEIHDT